MARALASVYLYRAASIPLLIFQDQRQEYFDRLAEADRGDAHGLVDFVAERATDAMELVADSIGAGVEDRLAGLRSLLTAQGGLSHAESTRWRPGC